MTEPRASLYHRHCCPGDIIAEAVWLYFRFPLSYSMVEDMLAHCGISITNKTVYEWAEKFGRAYAASIRRRNSRFGDKWHLDECVISIKGKDHILCRAVDRDSLVLDDLVQKRRKTLHEKTSLCAGLFSAHHGH